jgi:hypothetical protein
MMDDLTMPPTGARPEAAAPQIKSQIIKSPISGPGRTVSGGRRRP